MYNDLRQFLHYQGVGFPRIICLSVGDKFLKHMTSSLLPLILDMWKTIDDSHNRGGAAPDLELGEKIGRKNLGQKKTSRIGSAWSNTCYTGGSEWGRFLKKTIGQMCHLSSNISLILFKGIASNKPTPYLHVLRHKSHLNALNGL